MKKNTVVWTILFLAGFFLEGCSATLREKKATEDDAGNITQVKFTGSNVKLVHDF